MAKIEPSAFLVNMAKRDRSRRGPDRGFKRPSDRRALARMSLRQSHFPSKLAEGAPQRNPRAVHSRGSWRRETARKTGFLFPSSIPAGTERRNARQHAEPGHLEGVEISPFCRWTAHRRKRAVRSTEKQASASFGMRRTPVLLFMRFCYSSASPSHWTSTMVPPENSMYSLFKI